MAVTWWKAELPLGRDFTGQMPIYSLISSAVYHSRVQAGKDVQSMHTPRESGMPRSGITRETTILSSQKMKSNLLRKVLPWLNVVHGKAKL